MLKAQLDQGGYRGGMVKNSIRYAMPLGHNKTRIMVTVGPSSKNYDTLMQMIKSGATIFRLNGAHIKHGVGPKELNYDEAEQIVHNLSMLRDQYGEIIEIFFDLGGPKIRVAEVMGVQPNCLHPQIGETVRLYSRQHRRRIQQYRAIIEEFRKLHGGTEPDLSNPIFIDFLHKNDAATNDLFLDIDNFDSFPPDKPINLKDGWCKLKIVNRGADELLCEVVYVDSQFRFEAGQGANPQHYIFPSIITQKDKEDVEWALRMGVDAISLSFVCHSSDADALRKTIEEKKKLIQQDRNFILSKPSTYRRYISDEYMIPIFAKIETVFAVDWDKAKEYAQQKGLENPKVYPVEAIANSFDGLMVARGDLAVEVDKYKVPYYQRKIIEIARLYHRPVIVATEMLESMKKGDASTRAEISDINTAVHQEADILMLSGETASTRGNPVDAVKEMREAIRQAEVERLTHDRQKNYEVLQDQFLSSELLVERFPTLRERLGEANQVCISARSCDSTVIFVSATTGDSVRAAAFYRPPQRIIAITSDLLTAVRLGLYRGVYPVCFEKPLRRTLEDFIDCANEIHYQLSIEVPKHIRKKRDTFAVPGLLRLEPRTPNGPYAKVSLPNTIHEFILPIQSIRVPEVERKYILSQRSYDVLYKELQATASRWRHLRQQNIYLSDEKKLIFREKGMLRVRLEHVISSSDQQELEKGPNIFFTVKLPPRAGSRKYVVRDEQEFNVTDDLAQFIIPKNDEFHLELDVNSVPYTCRKFIWERWQGKLAQHFPDAAQFNLSKLASSVNYRLTAEMPNELVLELDKTLFEVGDNQWVTEYELEIEHRNDMHTSRLVDEYIHDKFATLDIPVIVDSSYPSKAVRALVYSKHLPPDQVKSSLEKYMSLITQPHRQLCDKCRHLSV